jgi:hypothetical protein
METITRWHHYLAYFFGGAFIANALPHLGNGISGHAFQSPFATPPGVGLSSSTVNVLWGLLNLAVGYLLVCRVGDFELRKTRHILVLGAGRKGSGQDKVWIFKGKCPIDGRSQSLNHHFYQRNCHYKGTMTP